MTYFLTFRRVLRLHELVVDMTGGEHGMLSIPAVESAVAQPQMTFDGQDFYPTLAEKAAALGFSLVKNHGFNDGNKRIGFAAMVLFLRLNGLDWYGEVDEAEQMILRLADSKLSREDFTEWVTAHVQPKRNEHELP